jgi:replication factor C subunit 2/4
MEYFDFINDKKNIINKSEKKINKKNLLPWIEKYRPKKVSEIISQDKIVNSLKLSLNNNNLPHLLFYGPPGTGKTSTILAIGRELFGPKLMKERIIELNASDDRGINSVRNKIKIYAMNAINQKNSNFPCPSYKIIVLDEADSMTKDAQAALRKIMEDYSYITRFCFICNYINKIIDPISSRCAQYCFVPLDKKLMAIKLQNIAQAEQINYNKQMINKIVDISDGDMRKSIIMLQNIKYMKQYNNNITIDQIIEINGYLPDTKINFIIDSIKNKSFNDNLDIIKDLHSSGYSIDYFIEQFFMAIINDNNISDEIKSKISVHLSSNQQKIIDGSSEYVQLLDIIMFSYICLHPE